MRGIDDVLKEGFERHSRALGARGGVLSTRGRIVGAIRRRRRIRAGVTGAASVVAVGALAGGVFVALPHMVDRDPADPGAYPWCDVSTYPIPNPDAYTEYSSYQGRVYADAATMEFVFVASDGTQEVLQPDTSGAVIVELSDGFSIGILAPHEMQEAIAEGPTFYDLWRVGDEQAATIGHTTLPDPNGLRLAYEWTTDVPDVIPDGIAIEGLIPTHLATLGYPGAGFSGQVVPEGAVVQTVVRMTDGREVVTDIAVGDAPLIGSFEGLESVTTRVTLPGGEVFEIVSTYDPTKTWAAACTSPDTVVNPTPVGAYPWCDTTTYPLPNPEAFGVGFPYEGRVYADYQKMEFVYASPDGSHEVLEQDAYGAFLTTAPDGTELTVFRAGGAGLQPSTPRIIDFWVTSDGSVAALEQPSPESSEDPMLGYEWTTIIPEEAPPGVSVSDLAEVHWDSLGFGGTGLSESAVPEGAVVQMVVRWTDGSEGVWDIGVNESGAGGVQDLTGVSTISTRVSNLPDGEVFEIVSTYDPTKTWAVACLGAGVSETPAPTPSQSSGVPEYHSGPYFEGPESDAFSCLAPLPVDAEDRISVTVETGVGLAYLSDVDETVDLGTGGAIIRTAYDYWDGVEEAVPMYPGWAATGRFLVDDTLRGAIVFNALAWVDADGTIIGREVDLPDDSVESSPPTYGDNIWLSEVEGHETLIATRSDLASRGVPCDGVDPSELEDATIVFVHGSGSSSEDMTWSWTRLPEAP